MRYEKSSRERPTGHPQPFIRFLFRVISRGDVVGPQGFPHDAGAVPLGEEKAAGSGNRGKEVGISLGARKSHDFSGTTYKFA